MWRAKKSGFYECPEFKSEMIWSSTNGTKKIVSILEVSGFSKGSEVESNTIIREWILDLCSTYDGDDKHGNPFSTWGHKEKKYPISVVQYIQHTFYFLNMKLQVDNWHWVVRDEIFSHNPYRRNLLEILMYQLLCSSYMKYKTHGLQIFKVFQMRKNTYQSSNLNCGAGGRQG